MILVLLGLLILPLAAAAAPASSAAKPAKSRVATATFSMGCFWCAETDYEGIPGVISVTSGYTGGPEKNPTYEQVSAGLTGHQESIEIKFDPARISYERLVDIFWHSVDPTQANGQFCDHGRQYVSAIYYHDEAQKNVALESKRRIEASGVLKEPIVTRIQAASAFWPAEDYHQDFWKKDPVRYHSYREGCGRDRRLVEIWGKSAAKPSAH
jgi:peptide-methionine (S)-S-oxide reductase